MLFVVGSNQMLPGCVPDLTTSMFEPSSPNGMRRISSFIESAKYKRRLTSSTARLPGVFMYLVATPFSS